MSDSPETFISSIDVKLVIEQNTNTVTDMNVTKKETNVKKKINILEFMGVIDVPEEDENKLCSKQKIEGSSDGEERETTGESDSGLDDDKSGCCELSDDLHITDSDSDDDVSLNGDYTFCDESLGHVTEIDDNSYDVAERHEDSDSSSEESSIQLLKFESDLKDDSECNLTSMTTNEEMDSNEEEDDDDDDTSSQGSVGEYTIHEESDEMEEVPIINITEASDTSGNELNTSDETHRETNETEVLVKCIKFDPKSSNDDDDDVVELEKEPIINVIEASDTSGNELETSTETQRETNGSEVLVKRVEFDLKSSNDDDDVVELEKEPIVNVIEASDTSGNELETSTETQRETNETEVLVKRVEFDLNSSNDNGAAELESETPETSDEKVDEAQAKGEDLTLKDYDMTIKDIELERKRIIGNQAVRRKTIQNWVNGQMLEEFEGEPPKVPVVKVADSVEAEINECCAKDVLEKMTEAIESAETKDSGNPEEEDREEKTLPANGEIDSESIILNKESTKTYWENKMMPKEENALESADEELCDFQELDLNEPRHVEEPKVPIKHVPVVIHKKAKVSSILPTVSVESMKPRFSGNIVEQEIHLQQMREEEFKREYSLRSPSNDGDFEEIVDKPQVVGEVYRKGSDSACTTPVPQTNEFTAEIVIAPPTHYRDGSDSGTYNSENSSVHIQQLDEDERNFVSPDCDKKSTDQETSSDLGDELQCTSPSINNTGSYESLNSVGTGSSVDFNPRRPEKLVTVRPISDERQVGPTFNYRDETPIEREIRINREREEEMRIENKIKSLVLNQTNRNRSANNFVEVRNQRNEAKTTEDVKSHPTSRIQKEIVEQSTRESEVKALGQAKTTSPKDQVDNSRNSNTNGNVTNTQTGHQQASRRTSLPMLVKGGLSMQKFISSGGKLGGLAGPFGSNVSSQAIESKKIPVYEPAAIIKKPPSERDPSNKVVVRKSLCSAESKIQIELQQMKERENELQRQRSRLQSSKASNNGDVSAKSSNDYNKDETTPTIKSLKERCLSNPNLIDIDDTDSVKLRSKEKVQSTAPRRRSILIEKWENKIQDEASK